MDKGDDSYYGSGIHPWNPIEQIPQSIIEEYGDKKICVSEQDGASGALGAVQVLDVGYTGYICQVYSCGDGRLFILHRDVVQSTHGYLAPQVIGIGKATRVAVEFES